MSAPLDRLDRAVLVQQVMEIRDRCDRLLDVLLPEGSVGCPHPPHAIKDDSTMDDEGQLYRCTLCGATQSTPFHHLSGE
ncbi:MAG: hypothetical protein C0503_02905 [Gemmatimonas sp.]|nr:hypothetical protein [Gemmatimonas sp.]